MARTGGVGVVAKAKLALGFSSLMLFMLLVTIILLFIVGRFFHFYQSSHGFTVTRIMNSTYLIV